MLAKPQPPCHSASKAQITFAGQDLATLVSPKCELKRFFLRLAQKNMNSFTTTRVRDSKLGSAQSDAQ